MATFIELLEEIAGDSPAISVPSPDVDQLVHRFGGRVRHMGRWNASTDGSLDIPIAVIRDAALDLGSQTVLDALTEIKAESFTQLMDSSAAILLIEKISDAYSRYFHRMMNQYQNETGPAKTASLRDQLVREIFGE